MLVRRAGAGVTLETFGAVFARGVTSGTDRRLHRQRVVRWLTRYSAARRPHSHNSADLWTQAFTGRISACAGRTWGTSLSKNLSKNTFRYWHRNSGQKP